MVNNSTNINKTNNHLCYSLFFSVGMLQILLFFLCSSHIYFLFSFLVIVFCVINCFYFLFDKGCCFKKNCYKLCLYFVCHRSFLFLCNQFVFACVFQVVLFFVCSSFCLFCQFKMFLFLSFLCCFCFLSVTCCFCCVLQIVFIF